MKCPECNLNYKKSLRVGICDDCNKDEVLEYNMMLLDKKNAEGKEYPDLWASSQEKLNGMFPDAHVCFSEKLHGYYIDTAKKYGGIYEHSN